MLLLFLFTVNAIETQLAVYYDKSIVFGEYQYDYRIYEAQFSDELFFVEHWTCPCADSYSKTIASDFDERNEISLLEYNIVQERTINEETSYFKFYVDKVATVRIYISSHWGQVNGYVNVGRKPTNTDFVFYKYAKSHDSIWICPSETGWSMGWWYVAVSRNEPYNDNHFSIKWDMVHTECDSSAVYDKAGFFVYSYYSYNIPTRCANFSIAVKQTTLMFGDIDLYMSVNNSKPNIDNHEYASQNNGDDSITLIGICGSSDNWVIYVGLYAWQGDQVPYVLTSSINVAFDTRSITNLPPQQFLYTLAQGQAILKCEQDIIRCEFYSYFGCLDPYDVWFCCGRFGFLPPQDDVSPWIIAPESALAKKYKQLPRTDFPLVTNNIPGRLTFVQYMRKLSDNDARRFTPNKVCSIQFNNMIVDSYGRPLPDITLFTKRQTKCNVTVELPATTSNSTDIGVLSLLELDLSNKLNSAGIQGCILSLDEYISYTTVHVNYTNHYCQLTESDPAYSKDPCCSWNLTISDVCQQQILTLTYLLPEVGNINNTECLNKTVNNYIAKYKPRTAYIAEWKQATVNLNSEFVYLCARALFGDFEMIGVPCTTNKDCIQNIQCIQGRCNATITDLKRCWWNAIQDTPTAMALFNHWDSAPSYEGFFENTDKYIRTLCTGPGSLGFRSHYKYILSLPTCIDECVRNNITILCYDPSCNKDSICPAGSATNCYRIFQYNNGDSNALCETYSYKESTCLDCTKAVLNNGTCTSININQTECLKGFFKKGYCSVSNITNKVDCEAYTYCDVQPANYGPWLIDFYGNTYCADGSNSPYGCVNTQPTVRTISGCGNEYACFNGYIFTYHNSSICPYSWIPMTPLKYGIWHDPIQYSLIWQPSGLYSARKLQQAMDYISFYNDVNSAIGTIISLEYRKKAIGQSYALLELLTAIQDNNYSISIQSQIDVKWVCPFAETVLKSNYFTATFNELTNTCQITTAYYLPSNYYKADNIARFSSQSFTELPPNTWSNFYTHDFIIEGQLVSDGVELEWNFTTSVQLCIQPTLEESNLYTKYVIITLPYTIVGEGLCVNVSTPGKYFAAKIRDTNSIHVSIIIQSTIASIIYWLLFIVCIYQILNTSVNKTIIRRETKLLSLCITSLFLAMRAVYFILLPIGIIGRYPVTSYIFFELPTFLFIMINSSIVYLWIEIINTIRNYGFVVGLNRQLQSLFLVWVLLLLACFSAFIAVFYAMSNTIESLCSLLETRANNAVIVSQAYVVFVAVVLILLGFVIFCFGGIIFCSGYTKKVELLIVNSIQRTWLIMMLSLSFSVIKSILMIIAVFDSFIIPILVFTLLEQIPTGILLYYMRPPIVIKLTSLSRVETVSLPKSSSSHPGT